MADAPGQNSYLGVLSQAQGLPKEFDEHFFDVPLAVRVDLDGRNLGDAMVVLSRDERVQLLAFTDTTDSLEPEATRQRWVEFLSQQRALGTCTRDCTNQLLALHYSLVNSQLSILTREAERDGVAAIYHAQPEQGSYGLLVRNQLNLTGGDNQTTGRYALQGQGSVGHWTALAEAQVDRSSDNADQTRHRVDQLYGERLHEAHFYRLGYFTPGVQGLTRQPRLLGNLPDTTLGLMFGSSEGLVIDNGKASATPIYVTPNRPGVVEIYRNGVLINSQPVQLGLQTLDTRVLPGGIYEVEVRLIEDGQETSRNEEFIYKPSNWNGAQSPWRYNAYVGRQSNLLSNWENDSEGSLTSGIFTNYLLHPRAVVGLSAQRIDERMQYGSSLDWDLVDRLKLYGNVFHSQGLGNGYDLQGIYNYDLGSLVLSHSRSWLQGTDDNGVDRSQVREVSQSSMSLNHRIDRQSTATVRLSHSTGAASGTGVDLGWGYYGKLLGSDANWRLSVFDRPGSASTGDARNRGVNLSLNMSLGGPGRRVSASLGSRTSRDGGRDQNASLSYQQDLDHSTLRSVGTTATVDRYGTGLSGNAQFQNSVLHGDAYAQTSSFNGALSAGLNLDSIVAVGAGKVAVTGQYLPHEAGLIVDVTSDLPDLELRADDPQGQSASLRPGRNVIPVKAYKSGQVQFDFASGDAHAAVIQPPSVGYHLNRGGVEYRQIRVMRTLTVIGRLVDAKGQPLRGALVINHASRSVSEADGFFAVEMSESTPTLEVRHGGGAVCVLSFEPGKAERENDVLLVGDQACVAPELVQVTQGVKGDV
nr:TcfC E-set like domain-containing protein [Pseudomonas sp. R5(2019)]